MSDVWEVSLANFVEFRKAEVQRPRTSTPGSWVNRASSVAPGFASWQHDSAVVYP
jgi:hypothetical protein